MIFKRNYNDFKELSLIGAVFFTAIFSGPIILSILYIMSLITGGEAQGFAVIAPIAVVSIFLTVMVWYSYIYRRKHSENMQIKSFFMKIILFIAVTIGSIASSIEIAGVISFISAKLFCRSGFIFYQMKRPEYYIIFLFEMEIIMLLFSWMDSLFDRDFYRGMLSILKSARKHAAALVAINVILLYICVSGVTAAYQDKIVDYSWNNMKGTEYSYNDIVSVDTGFKVKGSKNSDAQFYYKITFKNGQSINFKDTNANQEYDDTYTDNVAFDKIVMKNKNVKKTGSTDNAKYCNLDKKYVDRLCSIIDNK